ncbi:MAG: sialidase family protein, partial [Thermoanaerobaculia bacterium]|nr:sialidase family protein [Thermoanaerobaculia bacterium]
MRLSSLGVACAIAALLIAAVPAMVVAQQDGPPVPNERTVIAPASPEVCALLDDPVKRGLMDGLLFNLAFSCGREAELLGPGGRIGPLAPVTDITDRNVNDPANDVGHPSVTQSETSMSENLVTGTLCSGYNDSCEFFCPGGGGGFTGFSRSTDNGQSWSDQGAVGGTAFGDPSIVWREADGNFYFATLASGGNLALWSSTDDCQSFNFVSTPATGGDDKELLAVDNWSASPNYGNLYLVWTDFGFGGRIRAIRSTDGGATWSAPANLSAPGVVVQGAWPTVTPNGDVYVAWVRYTNFTNGPISIDVARSTDGGLTYSPVTSPLVNAVSPRQQAASAACGRPSLNGQIRYLASPQIASDVGSNLHVVYSYDPDGFNVGDVVDVFYRRSTDGGTTWGPEIRLNDDTSSSDQYFPTIQVSDGRTVMATWYDRRLDGGNLLQDYFKRVSTDNGLSWHPSVRLTDVSSPIVLDPSLATCYHGDYDQSLIERGNDVQVAQWADDRNGNPDVWAEPFNVFRGREGGSWVIPLLVDQ